MLAQTLEMAETGEMERLLSPLAVAAGGTVGAMIRWAVLEFVGADRSEWGAFAVNITGSFLIGVLTAYRRDLSERQILLLGTGFAGGLTTFSTFAVDVAQQLEAGAAGSAVANGAGTAAAALVAAGVGYRVRRIGRRRTA